MPVYNRKQRNSSQHSYQSGRTVNIGYNSRFSIHFCSLSYRWRLAWVSPMVINARRCSALLVNGSLYRWCKNAPNGFQWYSHLLRLESTIFLFVKRNTLVFFFFIFSSDVMFLLLVSVTFYRCIEKWHSKSFLPHFSTFMEILLMSYRKVTGDTCL